MTPGRSRSVRTTGPMGRRRPRSGPSRRRSAPPTSASSSRASRCMSTSATSALAGIWGARRPANAEVTSSSIGTRPRVPTGFGEILRSWAYRTTSRTTGRTRGSPTAAAVRRLETTLRHRGDCHRRRPRSQGDLPADEHRAGDHRTRSGRPARRRRAVAGLPRSRRSLEVCGDPAQEHQHRPDARH
jgi:hypothetical protein